MPVCRLVTARPAPERDADESLSAILLARLKPLSDGDQARGQRAQHLELVCSWVLELGKVNGVVRRCTDELPDGFFKVGCPFSYVELKAAENVVPVLDPMLDH